MNQVFGWNNIDDLVKEVQSSRFSELLQGYLVFAYKNHRKSGTLDKIIISKRLDSSGYMIGEVPFSKGWTGFLPNMPADYLKEVIYQELVDNKTEKEVIESFIENVRFYEER